MNNLDIEKDNMAEDNLHLEPRVARLETGLETLTRNVSEIAISMRENALATNQKIDTLVVAVTQAQAPKKTDWSLFISIGFFILALGSAVFWPLNKAATDNKEEIKSLHSSFVEHQKLELHPVGAAKIESLMREVAENKSELVKRDADLDIKIQRETQLMTDLLSANISSLDKRLQSEMSLKTDIINSEMKGIQKYNELYIDKLFGRVQSLESERIKISDREHDELMQWRQKAMGLNSSDKTAVSTPK